MILDNLQTQFTAFIERQPSLPTLAPAFFMDYRLSTVAENGFDPVTERCPFDTFWMVYESNNNPWGKIVNFALCQDRQVRLWVITDVDRKLRHVATVDLDYPHRSWFDVTDRAVRETLPEMRIILDRIMNHERIEASPPALKRLNKARMKKGLKKVSPYIVLTPTRIVTPANPENAGTGSPKRPHERAAHYRTSRKTGVRYPVRASSIHGGSIVPRDYRVTG